MANIPQIKKKKPNKSKKSKEEIKRRCWIIGLAAIAMAIILNLIVPDTLSEAEKQVTDKNETYLTTLQEMISAYQDAKLNQEDKANGLLAQKEETLEQISQLVEQAQDLTSDFKESKKWQTDEETAAANESKKQRQQQALQLKDRVEEERGKLYEIKDTAEAAENTDNSDAAKEEEEKEAPATETEQETPSSETEEDIVELDEEFAFIAPRMPWMQDEIAEEYIFEDEESTGEEEPETTGESEKELTEKTSDNSEETADLESTLDTDSWKKTIQKLLAAGDMKGAHKKLLEFYHAIEAEISDTEDQLSSTEAKNVYNNQMGSLSEYYNLLIGGGEGPVDDIQEQLVKLQQEADALIKEFPDTEYLADETDTQIPPPGGDPLVPGEADFSIVTTKEIADSLAHKLVEQWVKYYAGAANAVEVDERSNGIRYVLPRNNEKQTVDLITEGSPTGAHVYISPQQNLRMAELARSSNHRTICLDALVFMKADTAKAVMKLDTIRQTKKYLMPAGTMDRVAAELFNFTPKTGDVQLSEFAPALPSDGLLAVTYHNRARFGGQPLGIEYNSPRSCAPDAASIVSRHYLYTFDIVMEKLKDDNKKLRESFEHYFMEEKSASDLIAVRGYVPLYRGVNLTPTLLTNDELPVKAILKKMGNEIRKEFGYLEGRETLKGVLLPYPVRFPTDSDTEKRCVLRDDDLALLKRMVSENLKELKDEYGRLLVIVTGHTDYRGDRVQKNLPLSRNRAARFLQSSLSVDIAPDFISSPTNVRRNSDIAPYKSNDGFVTVMTYGCSEDYYIISEDEAQMYGKDKETLDKICQPDRRANIYVIVPAS